LKRGLLFIDRGSREREASEELDVICKGIKAKGDYVFTDFCFNHHILRMEFQNV